MVRIVNHGVKEENAMTQQQMSKRVVRMIVEERRQRKREQRERQATLRRWQHAYFDRIRPRRLQPLGLAA